MSVPADRHHGPDGGAGADLRAHRRAAAAVRHGNVRRLRLVVDTTDGRQVSRIVKLRR